MDENNKNCPVPYTGLFCSKTFANTYFEEYIIYTIIYDVLTLIFVSWIAVRLWQHHVDIGWRKESAPLRRPIFFSLSVCAVSFLTRSPDPQGWHSFMPRWIPVLAFNMTSIALYGAGMEIVGSFIAMTYPLSSIINHKDTVILVFNITIWVMHIGLVAFRFIIGPAWLWRFSLIIFALICNLVFSLTLIYFGKHVTYAIRESTMKETRAHKRIIYSITSAAVTLMFVASIQAYVAYDTFKHKYTEDATHPPPPPNLQLLCFEFVWDMSHFISVAIILMLCRSIMKILHLVRKALVVNGLK